MRIVPGSIQGRLSVWLILFSSSLLFAIALFLSYEVRQIVLSSLDRLLHSKMQLITGLLHEEDDVIELEVSEIIAAEYAIPRSGHYYKVILGGRVLAASPSLVDREFVLARLDSGMFSAADFRMASLADSVGRAVTALLPLTEQRAIRIETSLDKGITILSDSERLTEALLNIIENAVRYNRNGGLVEITSWERGDRVGVEIRDIGVGIGSDELERIFERFYRTGASRSVEGTGLGLSIARCIVEAHGGEIRVKSEPGIGSCFSMSLPRKRE